MLLVVSGMSGRAGTNRLALAIALAAMPGKALAVLSVLLELVLGQVQGCQERLPLSLLLFALASLIRKARGASMNRIKFTVKTIGGTEHATHAPAPSGNFGLRKGRPL